MDIVGVEAENAELLPEEQIYEKMKEYLLEEYSLETYRDTMYGANCDTMEIYVDTAVLQMCRIKEKNSDDFLLVPAWVFSGSVYLNDRLLPEKQDFAVINAIDGSLINAKLGY